MTLRFRASAALILMHLLTVSRASRGPGSRTTAFLYSAALHKNRGWRHFSVGTASDQGGVTTHAPVRVSSYNVLSSSLATPSNMPFNDPADLDPSARYKMVFERLEDEIKREGIICLQEVSRTWAGKLHVDFARRGYHFVTGLYGGGKNGYMGVGMAWPTKLYEADVIDIHRVSDDLMDLPRKSRPGPIGRILEKGLNLATKIGLLNRGISDKDRAWQAAKDRKNVLIFTRFTDLRSKAQFAVATYHMPCMFYLPPAMVIHAALAVQRTQVLAGRIPHILCGDFNFRPESSQYQLVTKGSLAPDHPEYPSLPDGETWTPSVRVPLKSAYMEHDGMEPEFTNYAQIRDEPFSGTLDYIFVSPGWKVLETHSLPAFSAMGGRPLPAGKEPSDHLFIAATAVPEGANP